MGYSPPRSWELTIVQHHQAALNTLRQLASGSRRTSRSKQDPSTTSATAKCTLIFESNAIIEGREIKVATLIEGDYAAFRGNRGVGARLGGAQAFDRNSRYEATPSWLQLESIGSDKLGAHQLL